MVKRINLGLQGGGAHGAFTWGALLRILDEPGIEIAAISGTSAGALNGAALKAGLVHAPGEEGRRLAKENLNWLWRQIGAISDMRLTNWMNAMFPPPAIFTRAMERSPYSLMMDVMSHVYSPYLSGPFYTNPLRRIVEKFHYDDVCNSRGPAFFVSATRVRNGKIRVFRQEEVTTDVILASACLPTIFRAVEIFDESTGQLEAFWDGGYTGNPALFPLLDTAFADDIVIININPLERPDLPTTPNEIENRINEISFNSSLMRELRTIHQLEQMVADGKLQLVDAPRPRFHMISDDVLMTALSVVTKLVPSPYVLGQLKQAGFVAADRFLAAHGDDLNIRGTVDLAGMFGDAETVGPGMPARAARSAG